MKGRKEMKKKVSFVIPCYNSSKTIEKVVEEIKDTMKNLRQYCYEIILVNDCSPDHTFEVIESICRENRNICGVNLAKNFGQHGALMAGFHQVTGDILVCLDDDGQTPANEVGKLLEKIEAGDDVVYASYTHKKHSLFRNFGSFVNEKMAQFLLGKPKELYVSSYFAARRFVVDEMLKYGNAYPYVIGLVLRTTKKISNVGVNHREREIGQSGYTLGKLLALWFNGFTAFSTKPLRIATISGSVFAICGFLYGIYTVIKKFVNPAVPVGFSSMMSAIMFIGGVMMLMLGLIGEYIGRMYICMNNAPQFVVRDLVPVREGKKENRNLKNQAKNIKIHENITEENKIQDEKIKKEQTPKSKIQKNQAKEEHIEDSKTQKSQAKEGQEKDSKTQKNQTKEERKEDSKIKKNQTKEEQEKDSKMQNYPAKINRTKYSKYKYKNRVDSNNSNERSRNESEDKIK